VSPQSAVPHEENALRARRASRLTTTGTARRARLSLRTALLVLALVPSVALVALWGVTTGQTLTEFRQQASQQLLAQKAGQPSNIVYYNLQEERRLSAEQLSRPGSVTDALRRQRKLTDDAVAAFQRLSRVNAEWAPAEVLDAVKQARQAMSQLPERRAAVDQGVADQQATFGFYTELITADLRLFTSLSHVANGEVGYQSRALVAEFWVTEMVSREDALLARGWSSGKLPLAELQQVQQAIGSQDFLYTVQIEPYLPPAEAAAARQLTESAGWQSKAVVEQALMRPATVDADGMVKLPPYEAQWHQATELVMPQLVSLVQTRDGLVVAGGQDSVRTLALRMVLTSVIGLVAVIAVIITSWRLTRSLRRRILGLHERAGELERGLPEAIDRLARGEQVETPAEDGSGPVEGRGAGDELTRLGRALTLAHTSALGAAVRQAEQHRGFEKLLQRIARRTQLLIGLQLRTLDEMERKHEDPEVLEGLFDLDHLTARLRRYEENLVILAGGQPQRRWRRPVPLLDVLRAAQGEVQDYRRILLDVEGTPWLNERAVGPVVHVLAELMENAAAFSKPPTPVEVRAALVGRGLAVEIEDRGLGMEPAQYDAANELMRRPPRLDVLAQADDVRFGLFVVARLADSLGLRVEFRPSAFGGTRVVVLVPGELVTVGALVGEPAPAQLTVERDPLPARSRGRALAELPAPAGPPSEEPAPVPAPRPSWAQRPGEAHERAAESTEPPLPRRIRQASLAAELRTPEAAPTAGAESSPDETSRTESPQTGSPDPQPGARPRSGATIGAFQRRSRAARLGDETTEITLTPTTEDRT
jgi:hypothetical protein